MVPLIPWAGVERKEWEWELTVEWVAAAAAGQVAEQRGEETETAVAVAQVVERTVGAVVGSAVVG